MVYINKKKIPYAQGGGETSAVWVPPYRVQLPPYNHPSRYQNPGNVLPPPPELPDLGIEEMEIPVDIGEIDDVPGLAEALQQPELRVDEMLYPEDELPPYKYLQDNREVYRDIQNGTLTPEEGAEIMRKIKSGFKQTWYDTHGKMQYEFNKTLPERQRLAQESMAELEQNLPELELTEEDFSAVPGADEAYGRYMDSIRYNPEDYAQPVEEEEIEEELPVTGYRDFYANASNRDLRRVRRGKDWQNAAGKGLAGYNVGDRKSGKTIAQSVRRGRRRGIGAEDVSVETPEYSPNARRISRADRLQARADRLRGYGQGGKIVNTYLNAYRKGQKLIK